MPGFPQRAWPGSEAYRYLETAGRARIYELIQSGDLETVKVGRATLVNYRSLKGLTQS